MSKETIESFIIELLLKGPLPSTGIVRKTTLEKGVTKEAVYKALRQILEKEIIVKRGKIISLSNQWIVDSVEKWRGAESRYIGKAPTHLLSEKSSVVYTCKTLDQLDALWNHNIIELSYTLEPKGYMLLYAPHYWFPIIRNTSEHNLLRTLKSRGYELLQLGGHTTPIDKNITKYFPLKELNYYPATVAEKKYVNIIGKYVIEVSLDKKTLKYINDWYEKHTILTEENQYELSQVLKIKGVYKLKISKDPAKVALFTKLFSKYFVIKK